MLKNRVNWNAVVVHLNDLTAVHFARLLLQNANINAGIAESTQTNTVAKLLSFIVTIRVHVAINQFIECNNIASCDKINKPCAFIVRFPLQPAELNCECVRLFFIIQYPFIFCIVVQNH